MTSANTAQKVVLTNSPNTGSFSYEPLESDGDIRLLKLQSSISRGAEVACELIKDNISRSPLYAAVSYTWANSGPLTKISVNGKEFSVRKNVADLLVRLRTTDYTRTLWIDSICIDQASENEKGSQVRLMGDIFAGASYVITWLDQHQWSLSLDALAASGGNYGKLTPETSDWFVSSLIVRNLVSARLKRTVSRTQILMCCQIGFKREANSNTSVDSTKPTSADTSSDRPADRPQILDAAVDCARDSAGSLCGPYFSRRTPNSLAPMQ